MPGPRDYTRSTIMALAHFSGGLCYCPGCPEPVLREVEGQIHLIVQVAHIGGAFPGSARFDSTMTDDQRRDLPNLMLLCDPHHRLADSKEEVYTLDVLRRWKAQRESAPREALKRLREVTPSGLRKIVAESLEARDTMLINALNRLETNDRQAATLMRGLIDELTEAYTQALDPELVYDFSHAANRLYEIQETLDDFASAVHRYLENQ